MNTYFTVKFKQSPIFKPKQFTQPLQSQLIQTFQYNPDTFSPLMALSIQKLTDFYIVSTFVLFGYTFNEVYKKADNYFSAALIYLDDTITNFIFYNMIFSMGIVFYKVCIWLFFVEVKENQTLKMVDKLKAKIIDVILFCYIMDGEIQMNSFTCIVFIFFSYILHSMAIFRAQYLIHTPATLTLNLNYRLILLLLLLIFFDYQMLIYSIDLIYSQSATHFIFVYYTITISLSIIEPIVKYFFDFYEKYTLCHVRNIDETLALISLWISVPRLLIQILLAVCLAMKFSIFFYLIFTIIDLVSQLSNAIKSYNRVKKLTDTMKNLKKIDQEEIKKHHDNTCMVCFQDMTQATLLPCKHFFHDECLRQWIIKNSNHFCPKCKKQFNFDNKKEQNKEKLAEQNEQRYDRQTQEKLRQERLKRLKKIEDKMYGKKDKKMDRNDKDKKQEGFLQKDQQQQIRPKNKNLIRQQPQHPHPTQPPYPPQPHPHPPQPQPPTTNLTPSQDQTLHIWNTPLQLIEQKQRRRQLVRVGSLPYGLPTEAVYRRNYRHIYVRDTYETNNEMLMGCFAFKDYDLVMMFADQ